VSIAYLDPSALVKRNIVERGSRETVPLAGDSEITATPIVSRAPKPPQHSSTLFARASSRMRSQGTSKAGA
jgi:hypothetical protein